MDEDRRQSPRAETHRKISGRVPATPLAATLLNISRSGCMAKTSGFRADPGATILLDLTSALSVSGQIVWQKGSLFGIRFNQEIQDEAVRALAGSDADALDSDYRMKDKFGRRLPELNAPITMRRR